MREGNYGYMRRKENHEFLFQVFFSLKKPKGVQELKIIILKKLRNDKKIYRIVCLSQAKNSQNQKVDNDIYLGSQTQN